MAVILGAIAPHAAQQQVLHLNAQPEADFQASSSTTSFLPDIETAKIQPDDDERRTNSPNEDIPFNPEDYPDAVVRWLRERRLHSCSGQSDQPECEKASTSESETPSIPDYVFEYAPLVWLYSGENYWPGTLEEHLDNTEAYSNYDILPENERKPTVDNLGDLNSYGKQVYTTSLDDPEDYPAWMAGEDNVPDDDGFTDAHAFLFTTDKGEYLDAFWFFFYSFNLGNQVLGVRFGNHIGDWEHTGIRFEKRTGKPIHAFYSEHEWGASYNWSGIEKHNNGKRMYTYSATGTHAMYPTAGVHRYVLPFGLLQDITDRGYQWDPLRNLRAYAYDIKGDKIYPSEGPPIQTQSQSNKKTKKQRQQCKSASNFTTFEDQPTSWFHFIGHWGDKKYLLSDPRQYRFAGELHYVSGPTGPKFKHLDREYICQNPGECIIHDPPRSGFSERVITMEEWETYRTMREDASSDFVKKRRKD